MFGRWTADTIIDDDDDEEDTLELKKWESSRAFKVAVGVYVKADARVRLPVDSFTSIADTHSNWYETGVLEDKFGGGDDDDDALDCWCGCCCCRANCWSCDLGWNGCSSPVKIDECDDDDDDDDDGW